MTSCRADADLFAFAEAQASRDAGTAQAAGNAPVFSAHALAVIESIARRQSEVHVDDVLLAGVPVPAHPNAWGAVWLSAIRKGFILRTATPRPCKTDRKKHAHQYPVYASLIFAPPLAPECER